MNNADSKKNISKWKREENNQRKAVKHHFKTVLEKDYTKEEYQRLYEAFELFISPFRDEWSMMGKIHEKSRLKQQLEAKGKSETDIFWGTHSNEDIRLHFKERSRDQLLLTFSKKSTKKILAQFTEIKIKYQSLPTFDTPPHK